MSVTTKQVSRREHKQRRKERVLQRIKDDTRGHLESGMPVMFWDDERGVYRSPDIDGNYELDRLGTVKAVNLELEIPVVNAFRMMRDNEAIFAMLRWQDERELRSEIPF